MRVVLSHELQAVQGGDNLLRQFDLLMVTAASIAVCLTVPEMVEGSLPLAIAFGGIVMINAYLIF